MKKNSAAPNIPAEILGVILGLEWSVQARERGNSQIRFWYPKSGPLKKFRAISTGTKTESVPKDRQLELVAEWFIKEGFKPATVEAPENDFLLADELETYLIKEYRDAPLRTIKPIRQHLERLFKYLKAGEPGRKIEGVSGLRQVTRRHFDAAWGKMELAEVQEPGEPPVYLVPKTVKNMLGNIRKFFRWEMVREVREGEAYLDKDPTLNATMPTKGECAAPVKQEWNKKEFAETIKNLACVDTRDTLLMLRYCGGLDVADTKQLQALHFERTGKSGLFIRKLRAKSKRKSKSEWIKIPVAEIILPMVKARLAACTKPEDFIFPWSSIHATLGGYSSGLYKRVKKAREKAGLPMKEIKALRHTFATAQVRKGVPIHQVGAWLGHVKGSPITAAVYNLDEGEAALIN
jgi:site-specific recombinase XerD